MNRLKITAVDPVEKIIEDALTDAGVAFKREVESDTCRLDFYLPDVGVYIECKQFHTPRIADQMARAPNVIAIQGMDAARAFAAMISPPVNEEGK